MPSGTVDSSHRYNSKQFSQPSVWGLKRLCRLQLTERHNIQIKASSFSSSAVLTRTDELMRRPDVSVCVSLRFSLVLPFQAHHCFYISAMICSLKRIKSGYSSGIKGFNSVKVISMFPFNENKLRILFILMMNTSHNLQFSVVEISDF